ADEDSKIEQIAPLFLLKPALLPNGLNNLITAFIAFSLKHCSVKTQNFEDLSVIINFSPFKVSSSLILLTLRLGLCLNKCKSVLTLLTIFFKATSSTTRRSSSGTLEAILLAIVTSSTLEG